jgi:cytochrome c553
VLLGNGTTLVFTTRPVDRGETRSVRSGEPDPSTRRGGLAKLLAAAVLALAAASLVVGLSASGRAHEVESARFVRGGFGSKAEYCEDCHGGAGQGYLGYLTMPRLAGQTTAYLEEQLSEFAAGRRGRDLFINMARVHGLSAAERSALAQHFREANAGPFGGGPAHLAATGKRLYEEGAPANNIPACTACHGPDAKGQALNPRLAGQLYPYMVMRLSKWRRGYSEVTSTTGPSAQMVRISRNMSQSQIDAVAAYLSRLH